MKAFNSSKKLLAIFAAVFTGISPVFAAATLKKTDGSSITMPEPPSISGSMSMPKIGSGFYVPGSKGFYSGSIPAAAKAAEKKADSTEKEPSKTDSSTEEISEKIAKVLKKAGSQTVNSNLLTASDLSNLNGMGLFGSLSGLSGITGSSIADASPILVNQNSSDSKKFEAILNELNELKKKTEDSGKKAGLSLQADSEPASRGPEILRFSVNGYDVLSTCKKVYFSDTESDGTFLLTGDRKYISENKNRVETFYFYFHAKGSEGGITKYKVTPAVSQDYENQYSSLYQLTEKNELEAQRTGNLVTLRVSDGDWKMDMLLSLDK